MANNALVCLKESYSLKMQALWSDHNYYLFNILLLLYIIYPIFLTPIVITSHSCLLYFYICLMLFVVFFSTINIKLEFYYLITLVPIQAIHWLSINRGKEK